MKKLITAVAGVVLAVGLTARTASAGSRTAAFLLDTRTDILAEILPASCTYALDESDSTLTVTFVEGASGTQFVLPDNMGPLAFDLNGKTITGKAGTAGTVSTAGGNGVWVFKVGSGTTISVLDGAGSSGRITGGAGGNGNPVGTGAYAFVDVAGAEVKVIDPCGLVSKGADGKLMVPGAEGNPWSVGGDVVAYTNGAGGLVVSGTGAAGDFSKQSPAPWAAFADQIKSVTIADGVESIGSRFFKGCTRLGTVTGGKNLVSVGENAFYQCMSLETIQLENAEVLETLKNAIVYQTAIKADGSLYTIPEITLPNCESVLYGTNDLSDPDSWQPVDSDKTMEESGYHFFKFVLKKIEE